jgi:hypothetical protein
MSFIQEWHSTAREKDLLEAMLDHPLMRDIANDVIKAKFGESKPCRILRRVSEAVSKLKHKTSSTHHWHAYSAILTALSPELGSKDSIAEFAHGIGVSPAALYRKQQAGGQRLIVTTRAHCRSSYDLMKIKVRV